MKYDISSQNLDQFFIKELEKITSEQKEKLPAELLYRIFSKKVIKRKSSFLEKVYVLTRIFGKNIFIVIEDEGGLNGQDFIEFKKAEKKDMPTEAAQDIIGKGVFVLGQKELMNTFAYLNEISASPAYNYLTRAKNYKGNNATDWGAQMRYISRFISYYEANRKVLHTRSGTTFPEWLILIFLYSQPDFVRSKALFQEQYAYTFNSANINLRPAAAALEAKGLIERKGATFNTELRITPLGRARVHELMKKYILNC